MKCGAFGDTAPVAKLFATGKAELRKHVADVEFHRVGAHAHPLGDAPIGHSVPHLLGDLPFGGGEHVVVPRSAGSVARHEGVVAGDGLNFPTRAAAETFEPVCEL